MKAQHIIRREYLENVRKKSFLVATFAVPVVMAAFLVVPILLSMLDSSSVVRVRVIDETGEMARPFVEAIRDTLEDGSPKYAAEIAEPADGGTVALKDTAIADILGGRLDVALVIFSDVLESGEAEYITKETRSFDVVDDFDDALTEIVVRTRLAREGIDFDKVTKLTTGVEVQMRQVTSSGGLEERSFIGEYGLVFGFVMIMMMTLVTWGAQIMRSVVEEKGSRVVEVLLSSISPRDLLFGKVVGTGLAGLTQLVIWSVAGLALTAPGLIGALAEVGPIHVAPSAFLYMILFYVLGFLLYSSVFTVIGAMCSNEQDAQQLVGLATMPMMFPVLFLLLIMQSPNGTASIVLSLIPLLTPMVMMARIALVSPPVWQIALSIVLLVAAIWGALSFSSRVFRVGILMYGKRPSLREVIYWYRQAG